MYLDVEYISNLVSEQFPSFYKEEGTSFIQFVKAYYEWNELRSEDRKLRSINDIDETSSDYLVHFVNTYLKNIPSEFVFDKKFFVKHALDFYRSKGSFENIRLLFAILFNENPDIILPSNKLFKPDSSRWVQPLYIELDNVHTKLLSLEGVVAQSVQNSGYAIIEDVKQIYTPGLRTVAYISNISGSFSVGDKLKIGGFQEAEYPIILGSVSNLEIFSSSVYFNLGDTLQDQNGLKVYVDEITEKNGIIEFSIVNGGTKYSLENSIVVVSQGSNTTGSGANCVVSGISNSEILYMTAVPLSPYLNTPLNSSTYSVVGGASSMNTANISSSLLSSLDYNPYKYGTISKLRVTNSGNNYDGSVSVHVYDKLYAPLMELDLTGLSYAGNNAVIIGDGAYGSGYVSSLTIEDSFFGYSENEEVSLISTANSEMSVSALIKLEAVGKSVGYWDSYYSHTDFTSKLQDDYYYQEYSYVIETTQRLNKYFDILQKISHPAGSKFFTKLKVRPINVNI